MGCTKNVAERPREPVGHGERMVLCLHPNRISRKECKVNTSRNIAPERKPKRIARIGYCIFLLLPLTYPVAGGFSYYPLTYFHPRALPAHHKPQFQLKPNSPPKYRTAISAAEKHTGGGMVISTVLNFVYPPPPSLVTTAMSVMSVASLANAGLSEVRGVHLQYSKFALTSNKKVPSRTGMLLLYSPAFIAGLGSFLIFPGGGLRFLILRSAISLHFFKRILEVLFVHKFSGGMGVDSMVVISLSYFLSTATLIYSQHLSQVLPEPPVNLLYPGIALFLIGIAGNLYHHILLSRLRQEGDKEYKIPRGGLFGWVICPHYLFEVIDFVGISFISQTVYSCSWSLGIFFYFLGRSYATRRWYISKLEDFPEDVKALIPFIF